MRPGSLAITLVGVLLVGVAPAHVQAQGQPKTKPVPKGMPRPQAVVVSVSGFSPATGRAGTKVTITGSNFSAKDKLLVGGRAVKPLSVTPTAIVVAVPPRLPNGLIAIRHAGAPSDIRVGTFTLLPDAKVGAFEPTSGPVGTKVTIHGTGFLPSDKVTFGGKPLAASELRTDRIVVVIPAGATSDRFTIGPPGGTLSKSARQFKLVIPGPTVGSFAPAFGPPGTKVKIFGANFTATDRITYGWTPLKIETTTPNYVEVLIPPKATKSDTFTVRNTHGTAKSAQPFALVLPPTLTRFTPTSGKAGTRVEIFGDHFRPGDEVHLGGQALRIADYQERKLTIDIPAGALANKLSIYRGGQRVAESKGTFDVLIVPTLASFEPTAGPVGTKVVLTGTAFRPDAKVSYGKQRLRITARKDDTMLEVAIPAGAKDQPFVITTLGGEVTAAQPFEIHVYSTVAGITPVTGPPSTRVTIRGANFNGDDRFFLGTVALPVVEKTADTYTVQIPPAAQSGAIEWESYGKRQVSRFKFTLIVPPTLVSFAPTSGPAGTQITLTGTDFSDRVTVLFGQEPCKILRRTLPTQLLVVLPPNAAGTDYLWIEYAGKRFRSSASFQVMAPPVVSSFAPESGAVGAEVTVTGANFSENSTVLFNGTAATVVRRQLPSQLVVQVPQLPVGGAYVYVIEGKHKVRSGKKFAVALVPIVSSIAPLTGLAGSQVTLVGEHFTAGAMVWLGNLPCVVVRRGGKTKLVVQVPSAATGKAYFVVEDGGEKVASKDMFEVQPPAQPPPQ